MVSRLPSSSVAWRWLGFVTAVWVQAISGNNYTFSNYSDALKSLMSLTQLQLNNLSVAKDLGKAFGLLAGLASDRLPLPVILLIGSLEGLIGYGVQWLVVSQRIRPLPYWQMCAFLCIGGNSTTWMNTAVLVTSIRNFRKDRGPVSGILKGYVGLSTAIFTDLSSSLFSSSSPSPSSILLLLSLVPFAVCLFAILFLREVPIPLSSIDAAESEKQEQRYFGVFNGVALTVALYLLAYDLTAPHNALFSRVFTVVLLVLLASPLVVPAHAFAKELFISRRLGDHKFSLDVEKRSSVRQALLGENKEEAVVVADDRRSIEEAMGNIERERPILGEDYTIEGERRRPILGEDHTIEGERRRPILGEDHTMMEAMRTVDFWVLFVSFLCGVGTGLAVMNNMGQMGSAMGYSDVSMFVSLLSISGFFGRIASGTISEYFIKRYGTPRPLWNAGSQILMAVGYVIMAIVLPGSLYIGSIIVGICYGVCLAVTVPTASELFGLKYYGLIYNILILNLPLGSFLFSGLLAGLLYDREATETAGGGNTCSGAHCYRLVFVVMAFACIIGFGLNVLLAFRTKSVYSRISTSKKPNNLGRISS